MLETLTQGFRNARARLKGYRQINEGNIEEALEQIKLSLLEGDVEYHVAMAFLEKVKGVALGEMVQTRAQGKGKDLKVTPSDHFIKICYDQLVGLMGKEDTSFKTSRSRAISTVMMVGLQGSGKTTTAAKLALNYKKNGHKPMLVAADIYRPAAVEQLKVLGQRVGVPVFHEAGKNPPELCSLALQEAKRNRNDMVIFDTAGRLAIDEALMKELEEIDSKAGADNIYLVVDAMIGQDAVATASEFNRRLDLDGVILTKLDGDARGGAALSVRAVTGKPIKWVGMGESMDKLEPFRPEGLASRILGFGDVVGLMQDFESVVDTKKAEEEALKMLKGEFSFIQFLEQIRMLKKLGPLQSVIEKLPFFPDGLPEGMNVDEKSITRIESIIQSMTERERLNPSLLTENRLQRIAKGSGRTMGEVHDLIGRFNAMRQMMAQVGKQPGMLGKVPGFKQMGQAMAGGDGRGEAGMPMMPPGMPMMPPGMPGAQKKAQKKFVDVDKRRRKEKMARQQRKMQRKKRKK